MHLIFLSYWFLAFTTTYLIEYSVLKILQIDRNTFLFLIGSRCVLQKMWLELNTISVWMQGASDAYFRIG
jgi:hypothetical protein